MVGLGAAAWIGSWFLAYHAADPVHGRRAALWTLLAVVLAYGALIGLTALPTSTPIHPKRIPQLGLVSLYFLLYGLVPAALGRLFRAPRIAVAIAILLPLAALAAGPGRPAPEGMGHLNDLLFLDPVEMGEGVTREGRIPHRFRVHWIALGALILGATLLIGVTGRASEDETPA